MKNEQLSELAKITIRQAQESDVSMLLRLSEQLGYQNELDEFANRYHRVTEDPESIIIVAEGADGSITGFLHCGILPELIVPFRVHIFALVVDEGARSRGYGEELVKAAEDWAKERGCDAITVRSRVDREGAHRFYNRLGFGRVKEQTYFRKSLES